jgi:phosphoribosylformimino-5-aminoimidazole carboxamide ribotide isomerase
MMYMSFLVIPALDLKGKRCVQLVGGDPSKKLVELEDPIAVAEHWQKLGARRLHLVDLDAAIEGSRINRPLVEEIISRLSIPVQFGGGIRSVEEAKRFLELGAAKVILGTAALEEPRVLRTLAEEYGREKIIVALDAKDGYVVIRGWREKTQRRASEAAREFARYASEMLFTNVNVEGRMRGVDLDAVKEVVNASPAKVIVSGGISSLDDIKNVRDLGAFGVVIGSALYTGKIDFREALKLEKP